MDAAFILRARRDPSRIEVLTLRYETRELALAAAATIRELGSIVSVTAPDGSPIEDAKDLP
jgi:hypothetical protein